MPIPALLRAFRHGVTAHASVGGTSDSRAETFEIIHVWHPACMTRRTHDPRGS
jgi:hypothetical protein